GRTGSPRSCGKARGATDGRAPGQRRGRCGRSRLDLLRLPVAAGVMGSAIDRAGLDRRAALAGVDQRVVLDVLTGARARADVAEHAPVVKAALHAGVVLAQLAADRVHAATFARRSIPTHSRIC